jgi:hypothetical protein
MTLKIQITIKLDFNMAISGLPKKKLVPTDAEVDEGKIQEWINKGGSTTSANLLSQTEQNALRGMNVKLYQSELDKIKEIRNRSLKRDRLSIHDWILEAITEKIEKEYSLNQD